MSGTPSPALLGTILSVGGALLVMAIILFAVSAASRARLRALSERFPGTVVFNGYQTQDFVTALRAIGRKRGARLAGALGVVSDAERISLWQGVTDPRPLIGFSWSEGTTIARSSIVTPGGAATEGVVIHSTVDGRQVSFPLQLAGVGLGGLSWPKPSEITELLERIAQHNRGALAPTVVRSPAPSTAVRRQIDLAPGWTSARYMHLVLVLAFVGGAVASLLALSLIVTGTGRGEPAPIESQPFFAALIVLIPLTYGLRFGLMRANKREARAGYTTLPRGDINRPYVDPVTGVVLREAGEPQLSRAELSVAARDRKLAGPKAKNPLAF